MPKQTTKSGLAAKYGSKLASAVSNHGADSTEYSNFGELPGGIRNGVAQLVECKFDTYKKGDNEGEYYFLAAGTVVSPETGPDGAPIIGLRTQIMEPVCDTSKRDGTIVTQDEHISVIFNELRKLGADTNGIGAEQLEEVAAALKEAAPYFRFTTSQSEPTAAFPNPRVWHNWNGVKGLENYSPDGGEAVEDDTAEEAEEEEAPAPKAAKPVAKKPAPEPEPEAEEDVPFGDDLDDLVAAANGKDKKAAVAATNELSEKAIAAGYSEDEVGESENWEAVAEMIRNPKTEGGEDSEPEESVDYEALGKKADKNDKAAVKALKAAAQAAGINDDDYESWGALATALAEQAGDDSSEGDSEEEFTPIMEGIYLWKSPTDKKPREYEVVKINAKNQTVNLKDVDTKKVVNDPKTKQPMAVDWSDLTEG